MAFTFETIGNNIFLVYGLEPEDTLDTMTLGMITKNNISGLVPALYTRVNQDAFLKYNITSKITMRRFFTGVVNRRRILGVFSSIVTALSAAEEYMIDQNSLLLDVDYIYVDVATCRAEVVCLPLEKCAECFMGKEAQRRDPGTFFKNIMFTTQFDETENCDYVTAIMNYLNRAGSFAVEDLGCLIEELQSKTMGSQRQVRMVETRVQGQQGGEQICGMLMEDRSQGRPTGGQFEGGQLGVRSQGRPTGGQFEGGQPGVRSQGRPTGGQFEGRQSGVRSQGQLREEGEKPQLQPVSGQFQGPPSGEQSRQTSKGKGPWAFQKNKGEEKASEVSGQAAGEKGMSMLYLLQHYSRDNVEAYKAQKNEKKEEKKRGRDNTRATGKNRGKKEKQGVETGFGFAVPGHGRADSEPSPAQGGHLSQPPAQPYGGFCQQPVQLQEGPYSRRPVQSMGENFGDTVVIDEAYGDTILRDEGQDVALRPYLLRCSNNEKILLVKDIFRIGKEKSYVDYCIGNNPTVSRSHADILRREGQFYIVDNNSTNHTYVNGKMIPSNVEVALVHGTKISLSNEEFEFLTF